MGAKVSRLEEAVQSARAAAEQVERWEREAEAARVELEQLEAGAGAAVVERPESAASLVEQLTAGRVRLSVAERAVPEAQRRHREAVAEACRAEADSLEPERAKARRALEEHQKRTAELLAALEEHTGATYRRLTADMVFREAHESNPGARVTFTHPRDYALGNAVRDVERRQAVLRAVADGGSPQDVPDVTWADLGQCLRAGGVADVGWTSPEDHAAQEQARRAQELAEQEQRLADLVAEAEELERVAAGPGVLARGDAADRLPKVLKKVDSARALLFSMRNAQGLDLHTSSPTSVSA